MTNITHRARASFAGGVLSLIAICGVVGGSAQTAKSQPRKDAPDAKLELDQAKFMRMKLEASGQILEGLTTENSELIVKGAKTLIEMSTAEKWQVHNNVMYRQFSDDFQRSTKGLLVAAEKENFDGVALKWFDTTMKCLECHKYVRGIHLAGGN